MAHGTNAAPSLFISATKTVIVTKNKNADQNMPPERKMIPCDTSSNSNQSLRKALLFLAFNLVSLELHSFPPKDLKVISEC